MNQEMKRNETSKNGADYDVVIVGGGPAGTTVGCLLKKYNPGLSVLILDKERFPRDHVGESQLPAVSVILDEMGVWDKIEAADFPIKIGASYTWGRDRDQWDFEFFQPERWVDEPRPAKFQGQRTYTAFQVDRAIYDDILLRHAESLGCEVREETTVTNVLIDGHRINGLKLSMGETVTGRYYFDASGNVGVLRKALNIPVVVVEELKNIAMWDYWEDAEWAVEIGTGVTRVQVRSLPYGWLWFIPLSPTRTSIGFICPYAHFQTMGKSLEEVYEQAVHEEPDIHRLVRHATPRGTVEACKDWSHYATELIGDNWFIVGEAAGFADPILAAGLTLHQASARDAAYTLLELERGELDANWLRERYEETNAVNLKQHIRFAEFWYASNGCFTDISEHCQTIAKDAGLNLSPTDAWRWLSRGGLINQSLASPSLGTFDLSSAKNLIGRFDKDGKQVSRITDGGFNVFQLNLKGAKKIKIGHLAGGRIEPIECFVRGNRRLPVYGHYKAMMQVLGKVSDLAQIVNTLRASYAAVPGATPTSVDINVSRAIQSLEAMSEDLWVTRKKNPKRPILEYNKKGGFIRSVEESKQAIENAPGAPAVIYH